MSCILGYAVLCSTALVKNASSQEVLVLLFVRGKTASVSAYPLHEKHMSTLEKVSSSIDYGIALVHIILSVTLCHLEIFLYLFNRIEDFIQCSRKAV